MKRENIDPDPGVIAIRNELNMDYGKLDYCIHNEGPVIVDVNKTVGIGSIRHVPEELALVHRRAKAIDAFFD